MALGGDGRVVGLRGGDDIGQDGGEKRCVQTSEFGGTCQAC